VLAALLGSLLLSEPVPEPAAGAVRERESIAGGWVQLAPLGFALPGPGATSDIDRLRRAVRSGFRWGFAAGGSFEPVPHLLIGVAASFDQTLWIFRNFERDGYELCFAGDCYGWDERGVGHLMRVGPELRLGYARRRWLAWALVGGHLGISRVRLDCNNSVERHCDRSATDIGPGLGGGLGLGVRPTSRVMFGLESSINHSWLDRRDDPFRAARTWDLALIIVFRF
jgi:hypothetical protein